MKALLELLTVALFTCSIHFTEGYLPVMLMHGITTDSSTLDYLVSRIRKEHPGTHILNSNAYPFNESFTAMWDQIRGKLGEQFVNFSKSYPDGFHLIGYSQGGLLCRGLIETYCDHNVVNFIGISPPLAGYFGPVTLYNTSIPDPLAHLVMNNPITQGFYSVANYYNDPHYHDEYLKYNVFLPYIDNEIQSNMSACYKRGFTRCNKIIMIGGPDDGEIRPWQSSYFSFYDKCGNVVDFRDRRAYKRDWFGLKTMDKQGKLIIHIKSGVEHNSWPLVDSVINDFIMPYLT